MTSRLILASQEVHDSRRQQIMQERAGKTANNLRKQAGILGVVLSGSAARGPVSMSSDIDLHVIISGKFTGSLPEWTFYRKGIIENLHTVREDELLRGWHARNRPTSLATWFHTTRLGDELHHFMPLWWNPATQWRERLPVLVAYRQSPDIAQRVAWCYTESARSHIRQARSACHDGAPLDGHHHLRLSFQAALIAAMIQRGWIIRGSKKRIEIARAFLPDSVIAPLLTVGLDVIGLYDMTSNRATMLCKARLQYRTTLLRELHRLKARYAHDGHVVCKLESAIRHREAHNARAYDYYSSLVAQNLILGPINHIRCFSGLTQVPQLLVSCLYGERSWPIHEFVQSDIISQAMRDAWLEIMALTFSQQRCIRLSSTLSTAVDNIS